ncbi:MAG: CPBP family intramembrane metalloprotease [Flavobacteriaceae bacterium]|nr:CPBP family intramembrane metalloprotease [Flavobacteriaceae bacterium]
MSEKKILTIEFIWFYLLLPVSFLFEYPSAIKVLLAILSFTFIFRYLWKHKAFNFKTKQEYWKPFWRELSIRFLIIVLLMTAFTYFFYPETFFRVMLEKTGLWVFILFVYSLFSVTLQEIIYRTYFFERYSRLFPNTFVFIVVNALAFSLAHIFLKSILVLFLTFVGGVLFALTYKKTRSTTLVCIEHALFGFWLFTVGLGEMLAFPGVN